MIKHNITRQIGNLRGFSTDSIFVRPSNVADIAINVQRAPDTTMQLRRGYQCQIATIGGMGTGTFYDPVTDEIKTVTIGTDGNLYNKLTRQIFFYYNGQITGAIQNITQANPAEVESIGHGLITGTQIIIRDVMGMTQINNQTYTITVVDANNYTLNGVNSTGYTAYTSGGIWSIAFADQRYLVFTIYVDPVYLYTTQSITAAITVNRAAQIVGNQTNVNTLAVSFGQTLAPGDVVQFTNSLGMMQQRNITSTTTTSITVDGAPVTVLNGVFVNQYINIPFGKGFDVISPYTIATFISTITDPTMGVDGLQVSVNGDTNYPAAFLQIFENTIIYSGGMFQINYWYWKMVNDTVPVPFPGSANIKFQNSPDFENASFAAYNDVVYIANGWDYPHKYDGQTVYLAGMPTGGRPVVSDNTSAIAKPFVTGNVYMYISTYTQIDNFGNVAEGAKSLSTTNTITDATAAQNVMVANLLTNSGWNTNCALAVAGAATVYGPDGNGFYYDAVDVQGGYTLNIGDTAYYADTTCAVVSAPGATNSITLPVLSGHGAEVGDIVYFLDSSSVYHQRSVVVVEPTSIDVSGSNVTVNAGTNILIFKTGLVFGDIAIVNGNQTSVTTIPVVTGHSIRVSDIVSFLDTSNNMQRRTVTAITTSSITISGIPVSVAGGILITAENMMPNIINIQRLNPNPITFSANPSLAISNNLRINIYRTLNDGSGDIYYYVVSLPNNSIGGGTVTYVDMLGDAEMAVQYANPKYLPNQPPISKYVKAYGNQMLYAGGERGNPENSDVVFFSNGNFPEWVSLAQNFFTAYNNDDDITGLGIAGTSLIVTKQQSLWTISGDLLSSQYQVTQIAPGTNIGCIANATIQSVGSLLYFLHTNGVYALSENQLFPTDPFGNPIPISTPIDSVFRVTPYLPQNKFVFKRAVAVNYNKDNQYLLFLPCEDVQSSIRTANLNSILLAYDYQGKNWYTWNNINAAGGIFVIDDDLYFQERRYSGVTGTNVANLYKQHRFYRLIDHADHSGPQRIAWKSSWEDLGQPEVRKKFCRCVLLMDRLSALDQVDNPQMVFSTYVDRIPNLQSTIANVTTVNETRNAGWSVSPWGWNQWSGYQDSFIRINLKQGTVAKSMQIGFTILGINMDIRFSGFQLEIIPENRKTIVR